MVGAGRLMSFSITSILPCRRRLTASLGLQNLAGLAQNNFPVAVNIAFDPRQQRGYVHVASQLRRFARGTSAKVATLYLESLRRMTEAPEARCDVDVLDVTERQKLLEWNATEVEYPPHAASMHSSKTRLSRSSSRGGYA